MRFFPVIVLSLSTVGAFAQGISEINLINQPIMQGSARFMGVGGAFGALGNDFTGMLINPAGVGVFRHNELHLTFGNNDVQTESNYLGRQRSENVNAWLFQNLGYVTNLGEYSGWNYNLGLTFNQNNSLRSREISVGRSTNRSRIDEYMENLNAFGFNEDDLRVSDLAEERIAFDQYLIDYDPAEGEWYTMAGLDNLQINDRRRIGRVNQWAIALSAQKDDKLILGGSLNIKSVRNNTELIYAEEFYDGDSISGFEYGTLTDQSGIGVSGTFGMIYKASQNIRLGFSAETPTFYRFTENTEIYGVAQFRNSAAPEAASSIRYSEYNWGYRTPPRLTASAAFIAGKFGFLSIDYDFLPYRWGRAWGMDFDMDYLNDDIRILLRNGHNFRVGTEIKINRFYLRMGSGIVTNPFSDSERREFDLDNIQQFSYNFGLGYHGHTFGADLTFTSIQRNFIELVNIPEAFDPARLTQVRTLIMFGFYIRLQ